MAALFPRWTNTLARLTVVLLVSSPAVGLGALLVYLRTPFSTGEHEPVEQPVQFDHRHHAGEEGIDCRYCHRDVETSPSAGVPPVSLCMNCHSQLWNRSALLEPVREAFFNDRPIAWERVNNLPDFVYFNHAIHVGKGVGCVTCHGRVDHMATTEQGAPLTMRWCLDCHRNPGPNLRPLDKVTDMGWQPSPDPAEHRRLIEDLNVHTRTSCTTCHR